MEMVEIDQVEFDQMEGVEFDQVEMIETDRVEMIEIDQVDRVGQMEEAGSVELDQVAIAHSLLFDALQELA